MFNRKLLMPAILENWTSLPEKHGWKSVEGIKRRFERRCGFRARLRPRTRSQQERGLPARRTADGEFSAGARAAGAFAAQARQQIFGAIAKRYIVAEGQHAILVQAQAAEHWPVWAQA